MHLIISEYHGGCCRLSVKIQLIDGVIDEPFVLETTLKTYPSTSSLKKIHISWTITIRRI